MSYISVITETTGTIAGEIVDGRIKAHRKHGDNSIEAVPANDPRWLAILGEEGGEVAGVMVDLFAHAILAKALGRVARSMTYDQNKGALRDELIDVATVAVAWVAALDRQAREGVEA